MQIINGIVSFEHNEKKEWEMLLERNIENIPPELLRELGEQRVKELSEDGNLIWARMAAQQVEAIPRHLH